MAASSYSDLDDYIVAITSLSDDLSRLVHQKCGLCFERSSPRIVKQIQQVIGRRH